MTRSRQEGKSDVCQNVGAFLVKDYRLSRLGIMEGNLCQIHLIQFDIKIGLRVHLNAPYTMHRHLPSITNQNLLFAWGKIHSVIHVSRVISYVIGGPVIRDPKRTTCWPYLTPPDSPTTSLASQLQPANPTPSKLLDPLCGTECAINRCRELWGDVDATGEGEDEGGGSWLGLC